MSYVHYRLGRWDEAAAHSELAVSLSEDAGRALDLPFVHSYAALVPAGRGHWADAARHVATAVEAAERSPSTVTVVAAQTAAAELADAAGEHDAVIRSAEAIRRTGRAEVLGRPVIWDWQALEVDALVEVGDLVRARGAADELQLSAERCGLAAARLQAAAARGRLSAAGGDRAGAQRWFSAAWRESDAMPVVPLVVARLALTDGRRLREEGRRVEAIARLEVAHNLLEGLAAAPLARRCSQELERCGQAPSAVVGGRPLGLTRSELAVARSVAVGYSNREIAGDLFISVKTVEFHLRNIYHKLGTRSRVVLAARLGGAIGG